VGVWWDAAMDSIWKQPVIRIQNANLALWYENALPLKSMTRLGSYYVVTEDLLSFQRIFYIFPLLNVMSKKIFKYSVKSVNPENLGC
jgi:hypothetical protein